MLRIAEIKNESSPFSPAAQSAVTWRILKGASPLSGFQGKALTVFLKNTGGKLP